jgi:hypothetical protein
LSTSNNPANPEVQGMTVYDNRLIAGGTFYCKPGADTLRYIAAWDGNSWTYVGGNNSAKRGFDMSVRTVGVYNSALYAGGLLQTAYDSPDINNLNSIASYAGLAGLKEYTITNIIGISPNPSSGLININNLVGENRIEISDITGRIIFSAITKENKYTLDLSGKDQGIYLYKITDSQKRVQQGKLITQ